ncbi:MAG: hypothetical protein OQK24_06860 [Magnetovibrio sp.]|nr:hypothetical protein [Magnetovibrio sp.]
MSKRERPGYVTLNLEVARDTYLDGRIRERQLKEQSEQIIR